MKNFSDSFIKQQNSPAYPIPPLSLILVLSSVMFYSAVGMARGEGETPKIVDNVAIHHYEAGKSYGYTLPVYQVGDIRFLSGGVGVEEREAAYPPFSVKLILAQKPRAFLAHVSLLIQDEKGQTVVNIPNELVTGPWVFINLPAGQYHIIGTSREGVRIERTIRVKTGPTRVHHLIWPAS